MQKIGQVANSFADANDEWTEGSVSTGVPSTILKAAWLNTIQRELVNVVEGAALALDAGDSTQLLQAIHILATAGTPTGTVDHYAGKTAPAGWLARNGSTIGNTGSGANHAGAIYAALYKLLWSNFANTDCPVTGGRGASATADWNAGKPLALMDDRGLVDRGFDGTGSVDPDRGSGGFGTSQGDQNKSHGHAGSMGQAGIHSHQFPVGVEVGSGSGTHGSPDDYTSNVHHYDSTQSAGQHTHPLTINSSGGSEARMKNRAYLPIIKI